MSGVDHLGFIVAAYGATVLILCVTALVLFFDSRAQRMLLARYETDREDRS